jgi:hypothetical protein
MADDPEFKRVTFAFRNAATAQECLKKLESMGYNREPVAMHTPQSLSFTYKRALEAEVMAIVNGFGGYVPQKPTPLWPAHGSHRGGHPARDRD